ncbi:MAG: FecR family protein [Leptospira sp.]|nr:FecR family protein [Leptospira sp.]
MNLKIWISILLVTFSCKYFKSGTLATQDETAGAVVTFLHGNVTVISEGKETQPKVGHVIRAGDQIRTKLGSIDIQTYRGEVIRIKDNSSLTFKSLPGEESQTNTIDVAFGNLVVKSVKLKSNQSISITSPTMVAGVRGTSFSFELEKNGVPKVKVFEGSVGMSFRTSREIIEANEMISKEAMAKLLKTLESNEVVLEPGEALEVNPKINEMVFLINTKLSEKNLSSAEIESFKLSENDLSKKGFQSSPQEQAELETLFPIEQGTVQKAISENKKGTPLNASISDSIDSQHEEKRKDVIAKITENAESKNIESETEIHEYYNILESIHKTNGETLSGAVIAQLGDTYIVHSTKGIHELKVDDIEFIEYKNFKVKTKPKTK